MPGRLRGSLRIAHRGANRRRAEPDGLTAEAPIRARPAAMEYRQDIQLLRAVAVLMVLGYHLGLPGFRNGLLGVDIFFVISGYLMEKLYRPEEGAAAFWRRRAARLLPAYFTATLVTLAAAFVAVLPNAFAQVAEQAIAAALFVPNIGYWSAESYFSPIAFAPLLHLWSLGVEFQYYLLVPAIVLIGRRWSWALPAMVGGSLLLCLAMVMVSPKTSFFMMPLRLWEFGLGMMVAARRGNQPLLPAWVMPACLGGLAATLLLPIDGEANDIIHGHPALGALLACALTAVALAGGMSKQWLGNRLGRSAIFVGDISYSLYLVHFPLIVFVFYQPFGGTELGDGGPIALLLAPVAVALAYLLYRTVERPGGKWVSWRSALIAMAAMIGLASIAPAAQARRFDRYDQNLFKGFEDRASYRCGKLFRITHFGEALCILQPGERFDRRVLLAGDSHADAIKQSFAEAAAGKGIGVGFTVSNEPLLIHPLGPKWLIGQALGAGASRIYLHYYSAHLTPELIEEMADAAQQARIPLTIILPIPESAGSIPAQLYEARHQGREPPSIDRLAYERSIQPLLAAAGRHPDVELIEVAPWLCDASRCQVAADDGTSYYFDANHLTLTGAMRLEPLFASQLVRPPNNRIAAAAKSDKERR